MNTVTDPGAPDTIDALARYWTETLTPPPVTAGPPPDYPRGTGAPQARPLEIAIDVPPAVSAAALRVTEGKPARLCAVLMAACTVVLRRHSGADRVCLLTPVTEPAAGEAGTNRWIAVRTDIDPDTRAGELFERVGIGLAGAFAHQQFPFARILELAGCTWSAHRAPLSDVAVAFESVSRMDVLADVASDLTIVGAEEGDSLRVRVAYRGDLFAEDTVRAFGRVLVRVLGSMLESPQSRVADLRLLSEEEEADAIARFRAGPSRPLAARRVDALVLEAARSMPDVPAFVHGSESLTYAELVSRAQACAAALRGAGVQPGDRVAVALDLGLPLPVALLGTLIAGAAFVPIDPRHPRARVDSIVKQVQPAAVIAEARLRDAFEGLPQVSHWDTGALPAGEAVRDDDDRALAYVMFTSGSTGEPSGVSVSHRSLANYLRWAADCYLGERRPVFALYSSIAFDLTLTSVFLPLVSGCSTVIVTFDGSIVDMKAVFGDPRVEVVKATPSHLKLLRPDEVRGSRCRCLIVGGEALDSRLAASFQDALGPDAAVFNEYGPTEATIGCTAHRFGAPDRPNGTVPIGVPIWNTRVYVLDHERRPAPPGVPGELWISGDAVAEGYFNQPERTLERFVDDPFVSGSRMYATGDRARVDASGRLYYLGRRDNQVKFNGMRIELDEIRAALSRLPRIRDSVVRILQDADGSQVMVAYYVARLSIDVSLLRAGLVERIPQEMIPNLFVRLPRLPLTLNGKVDVDRLPGLDEIRSGAVHAFAAPQTDTEKEIAAVWSDVLKVGEISVHSNFFELGGHSLLASQVVWKISERLGVELGLRLLFDAPTIAQLAQALDRARPASVPGKLTRV